MAVKNPPDGIFCANDTAAVCAIRHAKKRGIRIPEDLAIIGFNNDAICEIIEPMLSSVHRPAEEMGVAAVMKAMAILGLDQKAGAANNNNVTLKTHLVVRDSSRRLSPYH
jgi:LacI family transcriptional regulator